MRVRRCSTLVLVVGARIAWGMASDSLEGLLSHFSERSLRRCRDKLALIYQHPIGPDVEARVYEALSELEPLGATSVEALQPLEQ